MKFLMGCSGAYACCGIVLSCCAGYDVAGNEMPRTVFSNSPSYSSCCLYILFSSSFVAGVSALLDATCLSIVDGLRRKDVDGGRSYEEAEYSETSGGVGMAVDARNGVLLREAEEL